MGNWFSTLIVTSLAVMPASNTTAETLIDANFVCQAGKNIAATFHDRVVKLKLSDGRIVELPQTLSGSGARYANSEETLVFWNKGNTAFITESRGEETYSNCVETK